MSNRLKSNHPEKSLFLLFLIFILSACSSIPKEDSTLNKSGPASVIKISHPIPDIIKEYKSTIVLAGKPGMVDTGLNVKEGDSFTILADGEINVRPSLKGFAKKPYGTLLFRIGKYNIANQYVEDLLTPVATEGNLYLGYAGTEIDTYGNPKFPDRYGDDIGYFVVDIIVWKTKSFMLMSKFFDEASQRDPKKESLKEIAANFERMAVQFAKQQKESEPPAKEIQTVEQPNYSSVIPGARWAAIIGVSKYKDTRIPPLRYAAADAKSFYDWAVAPDGGKYAPAMVKLLLYIAS